MDAAVRQEGRFRVGFLYKATRSDRITALQYDEQMGIFPIGTHSALLKVGTDIGVVQRRQSRTLECDEKDEQMKFSRGFKGMAASAVVALGVGMAPAKAELVINPAYALGTISQTSNCDAACLSLILGYSVTEYYKANAGGPEVGLLAGSYSTVFGAGNETATITWDGPSLFDCGICILLVKDGNNAPNQIYFNLGPTGYGWDGMESIFVSDPLIWPRQGSISHVSLFSASVPTQQVPEPGSLTLLGIGLLGLAGLTRRRLAR
jgi:hypothetical protein